MSVKVNCKLSVVGYLGAGLTLMDQAGENKQELKKPMVMSFSDRGISSETELSASIGMNTDEIADLVDQKSKDRVLLVMLELKD